MLTQMLHKTVQSNPAKLAIVQGPRRVRYDEFEILVGRCAGGLCRCGIGAGDCVAVVLPNCPEFVAMLFACARLRAVMLPLNPQLAADELRRFVIDARSRIVIADSARAQGLGSNATTIADAKKGDRPHLPERPEGCFAQMGSVPFFGVEALLAHSPDPGPDELTSGPVLHLYTSGSTDTCKRLTFSQENLVWEARNFVETVGLTAADNILCTIPLHHSYGLGNCLLDAVYAGATLVLLEPEDVPFVARCRRVLQLIREEAIRFYPGVPYQFQILAALPEGTPAHLAALRLCVSSGDLLPRRTYDRFLKRYGKPVRSLYGSTEAGSIAMNIDPDGQMEAGSLGPPLRNVVIEIRDAEGKVLPAGLDGEIWVKSPTLPPHGYDNRHDFTQETFRAGFYKTGDIGRWDHRGHLILAGRKQSFIDVAGYKVDTSEVEEVLESCPGVREAAVLGVEVPRLGTLVKAAVVTEGPCRPAAIREFCRQRLAFYKVPRLFQAYPLLPRSAVGKVLKSELGGAESYLQAIRNPEATRTIGRLSSVSAPRRRSLVTSLVQAQVGAVLGQPVETVPRNLGFIELGMDSFGAIELHVRLEYLFDQELPQTFTFDHPTVDAVTDDLLRRRDPRP